MIYDAEFYELEGKVARVSAEVVLPWLFERYPDIENVIDVGCGTGEWAKTAKDLGRAAVGVDSEVPDELRVSEFIDCDLTLGYPCSGFDLAICLEVAEHLPDYAAVPLINGLCRADRILFSAATPGQPGVNHINCQTHAYWHSLFSAHNYYPTHIGPEFDEPVADFYRRNMYLYERP